MKNNRITPESQRTRLPFATILLIALVALTVLYALYAIGFVFLDAICEMCETINIYGYSLIDIISSIIEFVVSTVIGNFDKLLFLIVGILCAVMVFLMFLRKRNVLLFAPTVAITIVLATLTAFAILCWIIVTLNAIGTFARYIEYIEWIIEYEEYIFIQYFINNAVTSICALFNMFAYAALTLAWAALALLFISCGKGIVGIFKRAQKIFFAIFCIVLAFCAVIIAADIIMSVVNYAYFTIVRIVNFAMHCEEWYSITEWVMVIINYVIKPICMLFNPRSIILVISLVAVFCTGLWLYKPHMPVKKKKKKIDLVDYVELEYGDNSEVTMEVVDGDDDDEYVNISVHRQKAHENEQT